MISVRFSREERSMKVFSLIIELIILACMVALVYMQADVRMVIEVATIYLAMVIKESRA